MHADASRLPYAVVKWLKDDRYAPADVDVVPECEAVNVKRALYFCQFEIEASASVDLKDDR